MKSNLEVLADVYIAAYKASMDRFGPIVQARSAGRQFDLVNPDISRGSAEKTVRHFVELMRSIPEAKADLNREPPKPLSDIESNPEAGTF